MAINRRGSLVIFDRSVYEFPYVYNGVYEFPYVYNGVRDAFSLVLYSTVKPVLSGHRWDK